MALARLISRGQSGLSAYEVSVEVHLAGGLPAFAVAGLPQGAVRESKDRVRAALQTCGFSLPSRRIIVHLGPAEIPKDGGRFDLPIALGLIKAHHKLPWKTDGLEFLGELALNGELRSVSGILPAVVAARDASRISILPAANRREAALVPGAKVLAAQHLEEVIAHLNGGAPLAHVAPRQTAFAAPLAEDLADVRGQMAAKRALLIAAAGGHNLLMVGPPGSGKSMLARRLQGLLPLLSPEQQLALACIESLAGGKPIDFDARPPFRAPHHTLSAQALVGGGARPKPGEVSLADSGILFLDELPEFSRAAVEALREPLECGEIRITRVLERVAFPARFQLVAAMNPCPCGYLGDSTDRCCCTPAQVNRYKSRISGPLLDRFDLHVLVPRVEPEAFEPSASLSSETGRYRERVERARLRQLERANRLNARLPDNRLWESVTFGQGASALLKQTAARWHLTGRGIVRLLRVARTIADLEDSNEVARAHIGEAAHLRHFDKARTRGSPRESEL